MQWWRRRDAMREGTDTWWCNAWNAMRREINVSRWWIRKSIRKAVIDDVVGTSHWWPRCRMTRWRRHRGIPHMGLIILYVLPQLKCGPVTTTQSVTVAVISETHTVDFLYLRGTVFTMWLIFKIRATWNSRYGTVAIKRLCITWNCCYQAAL